MTDTPRETLPLVRQILSWWPRWRQAEDRERAHLRTVLCPSWVETLERLAVNVEAARSLSCRCLGDVLDALLAGFHVPDPQAVIPDLVRAVYPAAGPDFSLQNGQAQQLEDGLRKRLSAPEPDRKAAERRSESGIVHGEFTAFAVRPAEPETRGRGREMIVGKPPDRNASETVSQGKPLPADWPWQEPDELTNIQRDVFRELRRQGVRLDEPLWRERADQVGEAVGCSGNSVSAYVSVIRKVLDIKAPGRVLAPEAPQEPVAPPEEPSAPAAAPEPVETAPTVEDDRDDLLHEQREEVARLREELAQSEAGRAEAREQIASLTASVADLSREREIFQATVKEQARFVEQLRAEVAELRRQQQQPAPLPVPAEPEYLAVPEPERLSDHLRLQALHLAAGIGPNGDWKGSVGDRRRVLTLAADLLTLAESR